MHVDRVRAGDGETILVRTVGAGPGLVVLHGGGLGEREYRRLADALSDRFTVHLYSRRGRPDGPPIADDHTVAVDVDDLAAVLRHTGTGNVFGHSGGGFIALRAALSLPLTRVAVYDPGLSIEGRPSTAYLPRFEEAVRAGDAVLAITIVGEAVNTDSPAAKLPLGVRLLITRAFLHTPIGRRFAEAIHTMPTEVRQIALHDGPASDYAGITADLLLAAGARSPGYFAENCRAIADAVPGARAIVIPRASHNAANIARKSFIRPFVDFFAGSHTAAAR